MHDNPLIVPILSILKSCTDPISEHDLLLQLRERGYIQDDEVQDTSLALFRSHYLIMNALYQLQDKLSKEYERLEISALSIFIYSQRGVIEANDLQVSNIDVREYYLNWENFTQTTGADVRTMLKQFWNRYYSVDKRAQALQTLGLAQDADWTTIVKCYRRLAFRFHPDRGGAVEKFRSIRQAYELLQRGHN